MTQPPPRAPNAPMQPQRPYAPMQPLAPQRPSAPMQPMAQMVPMQPLTPLAPGERREPAPMRQAPSPAYVAVPPPFQPAPAYLPPPPLQPPVANLGLSQPSPVPNWGGIPRPRVPAPSRRPRGNKAGGWVVGVVAALIALGVTGALKSSSSGPDISTPSVSVSIPPLSIGGGGEPARGSAGHSGIRASAPQPSRQSGRALDLSGNIAGERVRVSFLRIVNNATPKNTFMDAPESGKRLVATQFKVTNLGSFIYVASTTTAAHVVDTKGHVYGAQFLFGSLREGKAFKGVINVEAGKSTVGYIAFEVPKKAKIKKVEFSASAGGGDTGTWTFRS